MSTCISSHGEFGSHELDNLHTCTLCHVLDEDGLRAELASASFERDLLAEALRELRPAAAAVDWHREYGVVLVRAMRQRDEARKELHGQGEHAARVQALDVVNALIGAFKSDADESSVNEDAELADINRRVAQGNRVFEAAVALADAARHRMPRVDHALIWLELPRVRVAELIAAVDGHWSFAEPAVDALTAVEATPKDHEAGHLYLSTACHHGLHDKCRLMCKYCGVGCSCEHHEGAVGDAPTLAFNPVMLQEPDGGVYVRPGLGETLHRIDTDFLVFVGDDPDTAKVQIDADGIDDAAGFLAAIPGSAIAVRDVYASEWAVNRPVGVEATGVQKHECSENDNGFGGYLCTCGELWPVSFGGCADLPKEQRAANKAAWDECQQRRAEMLAKADAERVGQRDGGESRWAAA